MRYGGGGQGITMEAWQDDKSVYRGSIDGHRWQQLSGCYQHQHHIPTIIRSRPDRPTISETPSPPNPPQQHHHPIVTDIPTTEPYINTVNPPYPLAPRNETAGP